MEEDGPLPVLFADVLLIAILSSSLNFVGRYFCFSHSIYFLADSLPYVISFSYINISLP